MDFSGLFLQAMAWVMMIGIISTLVIVHECGHFLVARFFRFQTPVFGIGLPVGPYIVVGHRWGTQFRIHAALLGGYVAIPELGDESQHDAEAYGVPLKPFNKFPIWQRALVASAGVGFNVMFAYLIMFMMLLIQGQPTYETQIEGFVQSNLIAKNAGVKKGDILAAVNEQTVKKPDDAVKYLSEHKATEVTLHLVRDKQPVDIKLTTNPQGKVGMQLGPKQIGFEKIDKSPPEVAMIAGERLYDLTCGMMQALGMIGKGLWVHFTTFGKPPASGDVAVGPGDVHGILAVLKLGADIAKEQDWNQLFVFTILISMDLAIINIFPYPALDGGHLALMMIEAVRGKPMGERLQGSIFRWGMISLLLLMAVIMVNDVSAWVTGKLDFRKKDKQEQTVDKDKGGAPKPADGEDKPVDEKSIEDKPADATPEATPDSAKAGADATTGSETQPASDEAKTPDPESNADKGAP